MLGEGLKMFILKDGYLTLDEEHSLVHETHKVLCFFKSLLVNVDFGEFLQHLLLKLFLNVLKST